MIKSNKLYKKNLNGNITFKPSLRISYREYIKLYYKTNRKALIILVCITSLLSFLGYKYYGLVATLIIFLFSILIIFFYPSVRTPFTKPKNLKIK